MKIDSIKPSEHKDLIKIWEASVRATHHFLKEDDISTLRHLILEQYFDAVYLRCAKDDCGGILGFVGVADQNIEMLFVSPSHRGKGVGALLTKYAIEYQGAIKVDVNEQNLQAVGFYKHLGFNVIGRSLKDGQGNLYPLLHMRLNK